METNKDTIHVKNISDAIVIDKTDEFVEDFLKIFSRMAEKIKDEYFEDIATIVENEKISFNIDSVRINFVQNSTELLKKMYETRDLKKKITLIHMLEEQYNKNKLNKWHPHGKSAQEQTCSQRISILNKRKNFMTQLLQAQQDTSEKSVAIIDENRKRIPEIEIEREKLNGVLNTKLEQLENIKEEYTKRRLQLLYS